MPRKIDGQYPHGESLNGNMKIVAEYIYLDKNNENYLMVKRTDSKTFPQFQWVKTGLLKGQWERGAPRGPKIPYFLPNLLRASTKLPLFICEGEKDTESVRDCHLEATCASGGVIGWTDDVSRVIVEKGFELIYICVDNDSDGERFARRVAESLNRVGSKAAIHFVRFKKLPKKGDVSDWIGELGTSDEMKARGEALLAYADANGERYIPRVNKEVQIFSGQFANTIMEIENLLLESGRPVFVRGRSLVQPIWGKYKADDGGDCLSTVLRPLNWKTLAFLFTKHIGIFTKYNGTKKDVVPVDPPDDILNALLQKGYWHLPFCAGVINSPTLRPDGTILDQPGYDHITKLWLQDDENLTLPRINPTPSKEEARAALGVLQELISEFPFTVDEKGRSPSRSVSISAMLTALNRGAFDMAPVVMFDAPTPGSGKSYMVKLVSTMANGRPCPVITLSGNNDEDEKRLGALILEGVQMFSLDNCVYDVGGPLMCQITEQPIVKIRILGRSEMPECEWRGLMFITGNNINYRGDMTRRGIRATLDALIEHPENRNFTLDPIQMVLANRGKYIAAAMTVALAYINSGEKVKCPQVGSYGQWSKFCREPLIWLGMDDPWDSAMESAEQDVEKNLVTRVIEQWVQLSGLTDTDTFRIDRGVKVREMISGGNFNDDWNDLMIEISNSHGKEIDARKLGMWLRRNKGQVRTIASKTENGVSSAEYRFVMKQQDSSHGNLWTLQKRGQTKAWV